MTEPLDSERPNIQLGNVYSNIVAQPNRSIYYRKHDR